MKFSLNAFIKRVNQEKLQLCGAAVMQHGNFLGEYRWEGDSPHRLYSLSKCFTSTAVGMAADEGYLKLTDKVVDYFPEMLPHTISGNLRELTLRDLLIMASGHTRPYLLIHQRDKIIGRDWVEYFLSQPFEIKPGSRFVYDTGCTYVAGAMLQKASGKKLIDFLEPRLFHKFEIDRPAWLECPQGRNIAGDGLFLRTKDLLKFGQLYLQKGIWHGERLLSEQWIKEAVRFQIQSQDPEGKVKPDWERGYGYQFWLCQTGAYRGDGKDSQFCIIDEKLDAVVAITANENRSQHILNAVWETLNPELERAY